VADVERKAARLSGTGKMTSMLAQIPFITWGEGEAPFYCLCYMDGVYRQTRGDKPATQGLYFCPSPNFSRFSLHIFGEDGGKVLYHRGDDNLDSIEFVFLDLLLRGVEPYFWHLFPREQVVVPNEHQEQYEQHRKHLCLLLYHFRVGKHLEMAILKKKVVPKFNVAEDAKPPHLDEETDESEEIMAAVIAETKDSSNDED